MAATPTGQGQSLQIYSEKELRKRFPDIHKTSPLASGTFGNVYRARESDTGRLFAVKVQRDGLQQRSTAVADEVRLLNDARGKHVVPLLCAFRVGYMFGAFAMPLADTCLNAFIDSRSSVPPRLSESILAQIFAGVAHLHTRGILHRDLKPANVLLRIDIAVPGDLCVWLADLGAGCRWPPARWRPEPVCAEILAGKHGWRHLRWPWSGQVGTVQYCAPEVLQNLRGGCSADCWSAGAIGFELIRGRRLVDSGVAAEALLELDAALQNVAKLPAGRQDTEWTQDLNAQTPTYVRTYTDLRAHICTHVRTYPRSCGYGCEPAMYGARRCVCEGAPPLARKCLCACSRINVCTRARLLEIFSLLFALRSYCSSLQRSGRSCGRASPCVGAVRAGAGRRREEAVFPPGRRLGMRGLLFLTTTCLPALELALRSISRQVDPKMLLPPTSIARRRLRQAHAQPALYRLPARRLLAGRARRGLLQRLLHHRPPALNLAPRERVLSRTFPAPTPACRRARPTATQ